MTNTNTQNDNANKQAPKHNNTTHKTTKQNKLLEQIYRKIKMLASTIQFSHNTNHHHPTPPTLAGGTGRNRKTRQPHTV